MHKAIYAVGGALIGLGAGFLVGRELTRRQLGAEYDERLAHELNETKAFLNEKFKSQALAVVNSELEEEAEVEGEVDGARGVSNDTLERIVTGLRYGPTVDAKPAVRNVFVERPNEEEEDYTDEDAQRTPGRPYIISVDEYMEGEKGHSQITLTYFAEDDTLVDEGDIPVDNRNRVVGNTNLDRFGHRSKDPKIVYVRNEKLGADYEILLHEGSFGEVVHGQVTREPKTGPRRMRPE